MPSQPTMQIEALARPVDDGALVGLAELLCESVESGFSVGFLRGLAPEAAASWWQELLADPAVLTWVARRGERVDGTVSLRLDRYETGGHRAEVTKLLVRGSARRHGVATALMRAAEAEAVLRGRTMLLLDTEADRGAELLYAAAGWQEYGRLDEHAADPDGHLTQTVFFVKRLPAATTGAG